MRIIADKLISAFSLALVELMQELERRVEAMTTEIEGIILQVLCSK
jgi:hypothetical protein